MPSDEEMEAINDAFFGDVIAPPDINKIRADTLDRARELVDHFIMTGSGEAAEILTELLTIAEEKDNVD